jgi:hypothetical protein
VTTTPPQVKTFLQRPEGKTGLILGTLLAGAACYGVWLLIPFLVAFLTGLLQIAILAGVLAFLAFVVSDKRIRTLASYCWKSLMRAITGLIVEIDPIGILKGYLEDLQKRLGIMRQSMGNLNGQMVKLKRIIDSNEEQRKHSLEVAKLAHNKPESKPAFILQSRQAGRLQKSNLTLQALYNKMQAMSKMLKKYYDVSEFYVNDIDEEIKVKTQERDAIRASYNAFTSARAILQGEGDRKALFDQAMDFLNDDYAMKIGEIEQFMDMSEGFIKTMDLENGVYEQDALAQFDAWDKKADQLLTSADIRTRVASSPDLSEISGQAEVEAQPEESGTFSDLFEKH